MRVRHIWLAMCLGCLGCHSLIALDRETELPEAERNWRQGQSALCQGQAVQAVAYFEQSLHSNPLLSRNHLSLAAAFLETNESEKASSHLSQYLASNPDHWQVRGHFAELLLKQGSVLEAREQFERFIGQVQEQGSDMRDHLIHAH